MEPSERRNGYRRIRQWKGERQDATLALTAQKRQRNIGTLENLTKETDAKARLQKMDAEASKIWPERMSRNTASQMGSIRCKKAT